MKGNPRYHAIPKKSSIFFGWTHSYHAFDGFWEDARVEKWCIYRKLQDLNQTVVRFYRWGWATHEHNQVAWAWDIVYRTRLRITACASTSVHSWRKSMSKALMGNWNNKAMTTYLDTCICSKHDFRLHRETHSRKKSLYGRILPENKPILYPSIFISLTPD